MMPYNQQPIAPQEEITGTTQLPLARVKKIIQADPDTSQCSNNAAFAISIATQMFIQHLVEQTHNVVKSERKPRRNIQYRDVANAVARIDNLEFLTDVVPRTTTFGKYKEKKAREEAAAAAKSSEPTINGQRTLDLPAKPETQDEPMADVDRSIAPGPPNGTGVGTLPVEDQRPSTHSPTSTRFDAVRNGYHDESGSTVPMEE